MHLDGLARLVANHLAGSIERVTGRQPHGRHSRSGVHISNALGARKMGRHQARPGVITQVLGLIRPPRDKPPEVQIWQ